MRSPLSGSNWWKPTERSSVAVNSFTGTFTKPKLMLPVQMARGIHGPFPRRGGTRHMPGRPRLRSGPMTVLRSRLDTSSDDHRRNVDEMQALWDEVAEQLASVPAVGGQRYVDRHRTRGKLLVRERIEALV